MRIEGYVQKGWGSELIWATNDSYCGKLLKFNTNTKCSMHFHVTKDKTWLVLDGKFVVKTVNPNDASVIENELKTGDIWRNVPLSLHQLFCIESGTIIEVSTPDSIEDTYRVIPGDGQQCIADATPTSEE